MRGGDVFQKSRACFRRSVGDVRNTGKQIENRVNIVNGVLKTRCAGLGEFVSPFLGNPRTRGPDLIKLKDLKHRERSDKNKDNGQQPDAETGRGFLEKLHCQAMSPRVTAHLQ